MYEVELTNYLKGFGASLVGFGELSIISESMRNKMNYGISIAVKLNPKVIQNINNCFVAY